MNHPHFTTYRQAQAADRAAETRDFLVKAEAQRRVLAGRRVLTCSA